jgi:signal transduction histidine kinase
VGNNVLTSPGHRARGLRGSLLSALRLYELGLIVPIGILLTVTVINWDRSDFAALPLGSWGVLFWVAVVALVEFLPVPIWRSLQVTTGFPLYTAVAFIYQPETAAVIAFLGSSDPREVRGGVTVSRALFNRSQLALALFIASIAFHQLGGDVDNWTSRLILGAPAAVFVFHVVNTVLVGISLGLSYGVRIPDALRRMRIGNPQEFLLSYLGLGVLGILLARLYYDVGWWAVAAFVMPLLLARQMFFRTQALEDATKELQDREVILRALSNRMAEERQDERKAIAGYLHDDLAQVLYRMALHLDISEKHLEKNDPSRLHEEISALRSSRDRAMELVRALIRDLHRSPLGREGLTEALNSYALEVQKDTGVRMETRLQDAPMAPPVQLLCYHVAREAVMNAVKHAEATTITISLEPTMDGARLEVSDNGKGFDVEDGEPEGHYGLTMMKERAQVSGGTFQIDSTRGRGTKVMAEFPTSWLIEAGEDEEQEQGVTPAPGIQASQK